MQPRNLAGQAGFEQIGVGRMLVSKRKWSRHEELVEVPFLQDHQHTINVLSVSSRQTWVLCTWFTHLNLTTGLWRDVFTWSLQGFYTLFSMMEEQKILNPDDGVHLWALHFVFLPRINQTLAGFEMTWNNHKLSSQQNKTPLQLWQRGSSHSLLQLGSALTPNYGISPARNPRS